MWFVSMETTTQEKLQLGRVEVIYIIQLIATELMATVYKKIKQYTDWHL